MPTYEYRCTSCGHRFEAVQSFSDPALTECPVCGEALRKVFGNVGIVLKGSGFYKTDSRSSSNGASKAKESPSESSPTAKGGSKESSASTSSSSSSPSTAAKTEKAAASTGS